MPKYHFKCNDCTREWWQWLSISQSDLDSCPHCNHGPPIKIPSAFSTGGSTTTERKQIGEVVEQSIIDSKKELEEEIKDMKNKLYDDI